MNKLIILGNDKISGMALKVIPKECDILIYIDRSPNLKRIFQLILKRTISFKIFLKMAYSEMVRDGKKPNYKIPSLKNNSDLYTIIKNKKISTIILFRAGLIVNKKIIKMGVKIYNIHAAKIPDYGGIGAISNALKDKSFNQYASLHTVTSSIDRGKLKDKENFILNPLKSYSENELIAYQAAIKLLERIIKN